MLPLTGYCDPLSVAPGEEIAFKISAMRGGCFNARLVRVICGDPNPAGPGLIEESVDASFVGDYPARFQPVYRGSFGVVGHQPPLTPPESFSLLAWIWPTTPAKRGQGIIAKWDQPGGRGFALLLDGHQGIAAVIGGGVRGGCRVETRATLRARTWHRVWASYDSRTHMITVGQVSAHPGDRPHIASKLAPGGPEHCDGPLYVAAGGGAPADGLFNGKIEGPAIIGRALSYGEVIAAAPGECHPDAVAVWDFSQDIGSARMVDVGPHGLHGRLVNLPARAMTGVRWTGREMCWRYAPEDYGAIHFHEDDLSDCGWASDFVWRVPDDLPSGVYAVRLCQQDVEDMIPFFVRPATGTARSTACVLFPTFTYIAYGNYARPTVDAGYRERVATWHASPWTPNDHPDYGLSTYNCHTDGSGIGYATRLRPLLNMRSAYLQFVDPKGSGMRHFPADTHLLAWLHARGFAYDVITDEDLDREGAALLAPYQVVLTTSHPEYHTAATLDALTEYVHRDGGRLMYLGGNGFYWRIATSPQCPGAIEVRRAEGGIRTWAAEPGEYYHAFDGAYGGLWRRNGRPPQALVGIGFTAQGSFAASHYRRVAPPGPVAEWVFSGVEGNVIGDFGLSAGGAAGYELDRADIGLGTPEDATLLATSGGHGSDFALVPEEMLTHVTTVSGQGIHEQIRADMVYFDTSSGGAVFAVGSITFCGSLPCNGFDNNISRIAENVLRRFSDASPLSQPLSAGANNHHPHTPSTGGDG